VAFNVLNVIDRDSDVWQTLWHWPKIELHRHLEGSIRLNTLIDVAHEFDIALPAYNSDQLRPHVQMTDSDEASMAVFLSKFDVLRRFYCSMDIIRRITHEAIEDAARDNVQYMELRFTPHALARQNDFSYGDVIACVCEEAHRAQTLLNIRVNLIISVNRHESVTIAGRVIDAAIEAKDSAIVAVDLAGQEAGYSARPFEEIFRRARAAGLHATVHAGEWDGASNVREAIEVLGATRIGHGVRSIEDSRIIQLVRERGVTLEVCPTSNLQSGAVRDVRHHPLIDLSQLNLATTINTDDPSISNITLTDELALAHRGLGLSLETIRRNILNAARAAFIPSDEQAKLVAQYRSVLGMDDTRPLSPDRLPQ
jgi:adenosine deaminase